MVSKNIIWILIAALLLVGCSDTGEPKEKVDPLSAEMVQESQENAESQETGLTKEEVAEHSNTGDCWIIVDDSVYDVSSLISNHQANQETLEACGRSMDMLLIKEQLGFDNIQEARGRLQNYYVGELN